MILHREVSRFCDSILCVPPTPELVLLPDLAYHPPKKNSRGSTVATAEITLSGSGAKKGNFLRDRNGAVGTESSAANSGRSGDSCRFLNPFREHNKMLELWKGRLFCTRMCEETPRILLPLRQAKDHAYNLPLTDVFEKCIDESLARISVTSAYSVATRLF